MDQAIETIIKKLTGITLHVIREDRSLPVTIERRNPEPRMAFDFSFRDHFDVKKRWEKHSQDLFFSDPTLLAFGFCDWYFEKYLKKG